MCMVQGGHSFGIGRGSHVWGLPGCCLRMCAKRVVRGYKGVGQGCPRGGGKYLTGPVLWQEKDGRPGIDRAEVGAGATVRSYYRMAGITEGLGMVQQVSRLHACISTSGRLTHARSPSPCLLQLCIPAEDSAVYPGVVDMLSSQGRMKYLRPLYRALYRSKFGKQLALDTFKAAADKYHPIARKMVEADLGLKSD